MPNQTITLYRNGDLGDKGFPISFSHRKFKSVQKFVSYINDELEIAKKRHGYKYLFTTDGNEIETMDEVVYGESYVLAMNRHFVERNYNNASDLEEGSRQSSRQRGTGMSNGSKRRSERGSGRGSGSRRTPEKEESEVQLDELEIAQNYNYRREKTRQRNLDRYPTIEDENAYSDNYSEDPGDEIEIRVFRNGNYSDPGSYVEVDKQMFRTSRFAQFITYLNEQMYLLGLSAGVRHIYTTEGEEIRKVDQLQNKGKYVVAAGRFVKLNYGENALYLKGKRRQAKPKNSAGSRSSGRKRRNEAQWNEGSHHKEDITVKVFENGNNTDPGQEVHVPKEHLEELEDFLDYLKEQVKATNRRGYKNLYTEDGKTIRSTRQVADGDHIVIATGRYINLRYGEHYRQMKQIRDKVNRHKQQDRARNDDRRAHSDGEIRSSNRSRASRSDVQSANRRSAGRGNRKRNDSTATESSTDPYSGYSSDEDSDYESVGSPKNRSTSRSGTEVSLERSPTRGNTEYDDNNDENSFFWEDSRINEERSRSGDRRSKAGRQSNRDRRGFERKKMKRRSSY